MAVAWNSVFTTFADEQDVSLTVSYAPGTTIAGIFVLVMTPTNGGTNITGVTFGGDALTEVVAVHTTAGDEDGSAYFYFLGTSIPSGTQDVVISITGGTTQLRGVIGSVTAAADTEIVDSDSIGAVQANPQLTLDTGAEDSAVAAGLYSGVGSVPTGLSGQTSIQSDDFGNHITVSARRTAIEAGSITIGWTVASDDQAMVAAAIIESPPPAPLGGGGGFGAISETPISALPEDASGAVTGTGASTLAGVTSAGSGTYTPPAITGTGASTLDGVTSTGSGQLGFIATGATTLDGVTSAGSGTFGSVTGTGTSTLDGVTSTGSGTFTAPDITGTGATTLAGVTSTGNGFLGVNGTGTTTLDGATSAGSGDFTPSAITGIGSSTLDDVVSAGVGLSIDPITGTGTSTLAGATSTGVGKLGVNGTGSSTLDDVTSSGAGTFTPAPITGSGASTLEDVTSVGIGLFADPGTFVGAGSLVLEGVTATGGAGVYTDPAPTDGDAVLRHPLQYVNAKSAPNRRSSSRRPSGR